MYQTPKACYKKVPVRRETAEETLHRRNLQIPCDSFLRDVVRLKEAGKEVDITINKALVPGEAKYIKEVTNV
jgi:hypothetical protein